jgi:hypothetical protein
MHLLFVEVERITASFVLEALLAEGCTGHVCHAGKPDYRQPTVALARL